MNSKKIFLTGGTGYIGSHTYCANATKAKEFLNWEAKYDIDKMCEDSWNLQVKNPKGYEDK